MGRTVAVAPRGGRSLLAGFSLGRCFALPSPTPKSVLSLLGKLGWERRKTVLKA